MWLNIDTEIFFQLCNKIIVSKEAPKQDKNIAILTYNFLTDDKQYLHGYRKNERNYYRQVYKIIKYRMSVNTLFFKILPVYIDN